MINCSCNIVVQNNTKLDLIIQKNGSEVKRTKALPLEENIYKLEFKFEDNHSTVHSLNYTCVWINPKNTLVLCKKNVSVKHEGKFALSCSFI